ncbi:MAG: hypothetical protein V4629_11985 [Pseudomonadota bacterium]
MAVLTTRPIPVAPRFTTTITHDENFISSRLAAVTNGFSGLLKTNYDSSQGNLRSVAQTMGSRLQGLKVGDLDRSFTRSTFDKNMARAKPLLEDIFKEIIAQRPDLTDQQINGMVKQFFSQSTNLNALTTAFQNPASAAIFHTSVANEILNNPNKYFAKVHAHKVKKAVNQVAYAGIISAATAGGLTGGVAGFGLGLLSLHPLDGAKKGAFIGAGVGTALMFIPGLPIGLAAMPVMKAVEVSSRTYLNHVHPQPMPARSSFNNDVKGG